MDIVAKHHTSSKTMKKLQANQLNRLISAKTLQNNSSASNSSGKFGQKNQWWDQLASEFLKSRTHVLISYSKLQQLNFSPALQETSRVVAYISNQISPIRSSEQQQKSINNFCNILKLISKKFDTKLWHNFREILVKATLKVWNSFCPFYYVYRSSE